MKYLYLFTLVIISGCAATGPVYTEYKNVNSEQSLLYIYRPNGFGLGALDSAFDLDDKFLTKLNNNGYSVHVLKPGKYNLKQRWVGGFLVDDAIKNNSLEIEVIVPENEAAYVEISTDWGYTKGGSQTEWFLKQVEANKAKTRIKNTRLVK